MARKGPKINVSIEALQKRIAELEAALDIERREHCATRKLAQLQFEGLSMIQQLLIKALELLDLGRPGLDFVGIAEGMGVPARRVATAEEFTAALTEASILVRSSRRVSRRLSV